MIQTGLAILVAIPLLILLVIFAAFLISNGLWWLVLLAIPLVLFVVAGAAGG